MYWDLLSASGVRIRWTGDRVLTIADFKPRHIGRPITFTKYLSDEDGNYDSIEVLLTFEGIQGQTVLAGGEDWEWKNMDNVKVWRQEVGQ